MQSTQKYAQKKSPSNWNMAAGAAIGALLIPTESQHVQCSQKNKTIQLKHTEKLFGKAMRELQEVQQFILRCIKPLVLDQLFWNKNKSDSGKDQ